VVVGAGTSGRAAARLLATLGATVRLLKKARGRHRGRTPGSGRRRLRTPPRRTRTGRLRRRQSGDPVAGRAGRRAGFPTCKAPRSPGRFRTGTGLLVRDAPIVAVTGTNGKTTTVMLISHLLEGTGRRVLPAATSAPAVALRAGRGAGRRGGARDVELPAPARQSFRPRVALLCNFSPNHLDWHADLEEYLAAKLNIFAAQHPEGYGHPADGHARNPGRPALHPGPPSPGSPPPAVSPVRA